MYDLSRHPYFQTWKDPASGAVSFLLDERVAPVQQSFYFVNPSVSADERWLWFHTAFPPGRYKTLGAVCLDPERPDIRHFPQALCDGALPLLTPDSRGIWFGMNDSASIWHMDLDGRTREVCRLADDYVNHRQVRRLATHLTLDVGGRQLLLDGWVGNVWFVGLGDLETGEVKILHEFGRHHNHAQFSPTDPTLFMIPQDWWRDPYTGKYMPIDNRIWLMDTGTTRFEPLVPEWYDHGARPSHEWWSADGLACWIDYDRGAFECDLATRRPVNVWPGPLCHGHCDRTRRFWCADESPYKWAETPCQVRFRDRQRDAEIAIASALPLPPVPRHWYHLDPHPQFSPQDSWVVYTTTVRGVVDVALAPVADLIATLPAR